MIIVNTTFVLKEDICNDALDWIKKVYLASAVHCGAVTDQTLFVKVLVDTSPDTSTYAIHIGFQNIANAEKWGEGPGASLRKILSDRWGEKAVCFHTYLEPIKI